MGEEKRLASLHLQREMFGTQTLLEICQNLRMAVNGSADPWHPDDINDAVNMLQSRVDSWKPGPDWNSEAARVDAAVLEYVRAVLAEVRVNYTWWQGEHGWSPRGPRWWGREEAADVEKEERAT